MKSSVNRYLIGFFGGQLLLLILWVSFFFAQLGLPTPNSEWANQLFEQKTRAANHIQGQKLVIVAGSSTHFGVNAEKISKELKIPTINFGTFGGLEPEYFFYKVKNVLKPGDTVIVALEYVFYTYRPKRYGPVYVDHFIARDPAFFFSLPYRDQLEIIASISLKRLVKPILTLLRKNSNSPICKSVYYTPYGDTQNTNRVCMTDVERASKEKGVPDPGLSNPSAVSNIWDDLRNFSLWCKKNNINVIATAPNHMYFEQIDNEKTQANLQIIKDHYATLGIPFIGDPFKAMLDEAYYFDTIYHPNELGKELYTQQLIEAIKNETQLINYQPELSIGFAEDKNNGAIESALNKFNGWEPLQGLNSTMTIKRKNYKALDSALTQFNGWKLLKASYNKEQSEEIPIIAWGKSEIVLKLNLFKKEKILFSMEFNPRFIKQMVTVFIDEKPVWQHQYTGAKQFYSLKLPLMMSRGEHLLKITSHTSTEIHHSDNCLLFKSLLVSTKASHHRIG